MNCCIMGAGAWGTAVAVHLKRKGHDVILVPRRREHADEILAERENRSYLPGIAVAADMRITPDIAIANECDVVFLAAPSKGLRHLCESIQRQLIGNLEGKVFLALCKGLETGTNLTPSSVIATIFPESIYGTVSGPTYAVEVAAGKPAATVLAVNRESSASADLQAEISNESLRVYTSTDLTGVEIGGCIKNVYAIAAGICDGLNLGDNAKAALITRSLGEMVRLGVSLGGEAETFYGLSGFGDLVATCSGEWSRNRSFGQFLADGISIEELIDSRKMTVEGYRTTECFAQICRESALEAPILEEIHRVLFENKDCRESIRDLMTRELKSENH